MVRRSVSLRADGTDRSNSTWRPIGLAGVPPEYGADGINPLPGLALPLLHSLPDRPPPKASGPISQA
jgi:hypothetical protein